MKINPNIQELKPSATLAINEKVKTLRSQGVPVVHFGFGQSPFPIYDDIVTALKKEAANNNYLPSLGLMELREAISNYLRKWHDLNYAADTIFIGPGSKELLYQTILILEGTFLIPQGSWVSYLPQIKARGGDFVILPTKADSDYKLDAVTLASYCQSNPEMQKSVILNSPNNPTGAVYTSKELEGLAGVCREYGLIVLSDEIYSRISFNSATAPSIASYYPERTFIFSGISKIFSAGGYRCGFMAIPQDLVHLRSSFQSLFSETFSAVASPVQYAALTAFRGSDGLDAYIKRNAEILNLIGTYVYKELSAAGILCTKPQGAFYMMVNFSPFQQKLNGLNLDSSESLASYFLDQLGVALLPGSDFYFPTEKPIFRLAFVDFMGADWPREAGAEEGVAAIKKYSPKIVEGVAKLVAFCKS